MRAALALAVGIAAAIALRSGIAPDVVEPAVSDEAPRVGSVAPELASVDDAATPPLGARLRAASPPPSRDAGPTTAAPADESVDYVVVTEVRIGPDLTDAGAKVPRFAQGMTVDEDVADLVEPRGPYRPDTFLRWIRESVTTHDGSTIALRDGRLHGEAWDGDGLALGEFLAAQRRRFAPAPAPDVIVVAATERAAGAYFNDGDYSRDFEYDVEVAQSPAVALEVFLPVLVPEPPAEKGPVGR